MTRRERHLRIIENFGWDAARYYLELEAQRRGLAAFTDESVERIVRSLIGSRNRQARYSREAKERRA